MVKEELDKAEGRVTVEEGSRLNEERAGREGKERKGEHEDHGIDCLQRVEGEEG
jgi:hypothetical protein